MTHTTDQDRAEFEKWIRSQPEWLNGAPWLDVRPDGTYRHAATQFQFRLWQAARRAQVVPQGWKWVPEVPTRSMVASTVDTVFDGALEDAGIIGEIYAAMLAAAPQSPEAACNPSMQPELATKAAPVQMPESISKVLEDCRSRAIDYATCPSPYNNTRMETAFQHMEHQVRQLLAAHGIKEPST